MAKYEEIKDAIDYAWDSFVSVLSDELGDDFDKNTFYNIADSGICKVEDYVMQSTDFGVNCPNCGERLDNEDELTENGCVICEEDE